MKKQLLINEISLFIGILFFIISTFTRNINLILLGLGLIIYSLGRIKKVKNNKKKVG